MIIFQRMVTFEGPPQDVTPWAIDITQLANDRTELNVSLWQGSFGGPIGTLAWSSLVENLTALEAAVNTLGADADYLDMLSRARDWTRSPGEDSLLRVQHVAGGEYSRPAVGGYAEGTMAVPAEGKMRAANEFGVAISDLHAELTHASVLFCSSAYGHFGELRWLALYDSAAHVEEAAGAVGKDADYAERIDDAGDLFVEGMTQRVLARRIA